MTTSDTGPGDREVRSRVRSLAQRAGPWAVPDSRAKPGLPSHHEILSQILAESSTSPAGCVADIPARETRVPLIQRAFELGVSCAALIVAIPVMAVIAVIIRVGTPGSALFRQVRIGINGRPFVFVKFRTLFADARERFPELYEYSYDDIQIRTLQFKYPNDPRITRQGRWLRKTSMDELPNLFLVLTGKLALVGPRPQIPEMLPYYKGIMLERFSVRPGLTDPAHVSGRSDLSFYETTAMDVAYARNRSWKLDLRILWMTLTSIARREGAF
jgi:lipopolysaccharide/colanic/teichoic acid biosynthesis glycosyltransferase